MYKISIKHNFELAHRLADPSAPDKCRSIHGHSWWATVYIKGKELDDHGMLVEFGAFKKAWRGFLDDEVDHNLALIEGDPLAGAIRSVMPEARLLVLPFEPTTENIARWLFNRAQRILAEVAPEETERLRVCRVHVQETKVNAAEFGED